MTNTRISILSSMVRRHIPAISVLALTISGCDLRPAQQLTSPPPPIRLAMLSGDRQTAEVGAYMATALIVRLEDNHGNGIPDTRIDWRVSEGSGVIATYPDFRPLPGGFSMTDGNGLAKVVLRPTSTGTTVVVATTPAVAGASLTFTTTVTLPAEVGPLPGLIEFGPLFDCTGPSDPYGFQPAKGTVLLGVAVVWEFADWLAPSCIAHLKSISVPPGGESFDSGMMSPGQRFTFMPNTGGTWEYIDEISGGRGSFTVIDM